MAGKKKAPPWSQRTTGASPPENGFPRTWPGIRASFPPQKSYSQSAIPSSGNRPANSVWPQAIRFSLPAMMNASKGRKIKRTRKTAHRDFNDSLKWLFENRVERLLLSIGCVPCHEFPSHDDAEIHHNPDSHHVSASCHFTTPTCRTARNKKATPGERVAKGLETLSRVRGHSFPEEDLGS